jgi:hypothetical protein
VEKLLDGFLQLFVLMRLLLVSLFKTLSIDINLMTLASGLCCYVLCVPEEKIFKYRYHHNRHLSDGTGVSLCYRHSDCDRTVLG